MSYSLIHFKDQNLRQCLDHGKNPIYFQGIICPACERDFEVQCEMQDCYDKLFPKVAVHGAKKKIQEEKSTISQSMSKKKLRKIKSRGYSDETI